MDDGIKTDSLPRSFLYALPSPDIVERVSIKKGNGEGPMGSKSRPKIMKANQELKNGTTQKKSKKGKRSGYNK